MSEIVSVQWFPGHMAKTRRLMETNLRLVDLVVEITDARIPQSSRNPELDRIIGTKPRILVLNKADSADEAVTQRWLAWYKAQGIVTIVTDCRSGKGLNRLIPVVREVLAEKLDRWEGQGMGGRKVRLMIVGIPNVGKSSLINRMAGACKAKVEDRPGVTRNKQWVSLEGSLEMLDMPGVLWPKFEDKLVGERLAFTGAVKDDVIDVEHLAVRLIEVLRQPYGKLLTQRYKLTPEELQIPESDRVLELIGKRRGMLVPGGGVNTERAAIMLVDEYRSGSLGRITLEAPPEQEASAAKSEPDSTEKKDDSGDV